MLTWVTSFNTGHIVRWRRLLEAVQMRSRSVVMLWMIVIGVRVNVQRRNDGSGRHQRPDEHQRQHATHGFSLCNARIGVNCRSFAFMAAGMRHFVRAQGETIVQLHGTGPWGITYVNPSDDPRKKQN